MLLDGVAISGYRSFGEAYQKISPLQKVNLLAGQNNSGKSNVLRFLRYHYKEAVLAARRPGQGSPVNFEALDAHRPTDVPIRFGLAWRTDSESLTGISEGFTASQFTDGFRRVVAGLTDDDGLVWVYYRVEPGGLRVDVDREWVESLSIVPSDWQALWQGLTSQGGGNLAHWVGEALPRLSVAVTEPPVIELVPAVRNITDGSAESDDDFSGAGIIEMLADLERPSIYEQEKKIRFEAITSFAKSVLDAADARIEIPVQRDTIHVSLNGKLLPIESLGTGIHEVMILAAAATVVTDRVICIEEPELHLHPLLQQKLLKYLAEGTSNQYIISTHSAHLLNQPGNQTFHVRWDDGSTVVERAATTAARIRICADLGYRASDLLQANAVIWVEGPSDRIYLRHWLYALDPELIEGIHYSIMFYGGRLLSNLSADDEEVSDFISLRRINQHLAILIDSDREKSTSRLNATKQRVRREFDAGPGFAWITKGREIENYVRWSALRPILQGLYPGAKLLGNDDSYSRRLRFRKGAGKIRTADKIKVARAVVENAPYLDLLDLRRDVARLVRFVRAANGLS